MLRRAPAACRRAARGTGGRRRRAAERRLGRRAAAGLDAAGRAGAARCAAAGQPLVLADADVAWLRSDAPRLILDTCEAGTTLPLCATRLAGRTSADDDGGLVLVRHDGGGAAVARPRGVGVATTWATTAWRPPRPSADAFSSRLLELYAGNLSRPRASAGARAGAFTLSVTPSDQTMLNYEPRWRTPPAARASPCSTRRSLWQAPRSRRARGRGAGGGGGAAGAAGPRGAPPRRRRRAQGADAPSGARRRRGGRPRATAPNAARCPTSALRQCARHLRLVQRQVS